MKLSSWAWAWAMSGCLLMGDAMGQGLRQPFSVRPAGFDYNRYLQDDVPSPSDQPAPVVNAEAAPSVPAPAAAVGSGCSTCAPAPSCNTCYVPSCNDCCGGGLGLGLTECCLGEPYSLQSLLLCEDSAWSIGGWTQLGYHDESTGLFNDQPGKIRLHQQWLYLEKATNASECCWDWGFRADFMYGIDANDTVAFGNTVDANGNARGFDTGWTHGIYGFALPQLYAEVAKGDLSIKAGHFYTLAGYESVMAPNNFFYSHAFTMYNSEPFTHTGVLGTYNVSDELTVYGGWTLGWDTGFDQFGDGSSFLGGLTAQLLDDLKFTYISTVGDLGWRGDQGYSHTVLFDMTLTEKLNYVLQSDMLQVDSTQEDNFAIVNYLFYTVSDCVKLGTRVEWWKTDPLTQGQNNFSVYEATFGVNYRPHANIIFRPEIRQQWSPAIDADDTIFGVDMIATY